LVQSAETKAVSNNPKLHKEQFVAAIYKEQWYIGQTLDSDETQKTSKINIMKK